MCSSDLVVNEMDVPVLCMGLKEAVVAASPEGILVADKRCSSYIVQKVIDGKGRYMAYLQADDLLYIPQTRLSKAGQISRQLADIILFQGFGFNFSYRVDNKNSD